MPVQTTRTLKRGTKGVKQRTSHLNLTRDTSTSSTASTTGRLDAIIVPASRPAACLQPAIDLAVSLRTRLVILCSKRANIDEVARQVAVTPGARSLLVTIPQGWSHPGIPARTAAEVFKRAQAGRATDLSTKRNVGLALARLHGWNKIVFLDDDITRTASLGLLAGQLERHQVAGMVVRKHPDNSVVCHARRLAGFEQDVFVTGAVLGVHCNSLPLSFFPDIYNEDWFFFAREAASRQLPQVGKAMQLRYDPFASTSRARHEEFGDLLAEGLFALFSESAMSGPFPAMLRSATEGYWRRFIEARFDVLDETWRGLQTFADIDPSSPKVAAALDSLEAAQDQLVETISPALCANFVEAWQHDLADWHTFTSCVNNVGRTSDAMDFLQLPTWRLVGQPLAGPMAKLS